MRLSVTITASVKQVQLLNKMKLAIVLAALALAGAAKLERVYLPPNGRASAGSANFLQTPRHSLNGGFPKTAYSGTAIPNTYGQNTYSALEGRPERAQAALERNAAILRQDNLNDGETFSYAYETENGIYAEESGVATNGVQAQGGYTYTGDDGQVYSVRYTADENGFVPQGDHLPTPPPIPEAILKSIELNARAEASRAYQEGSYRDVNTSAGSNQQQYYNKNVQPFNYNDNSISISSARLRNGAGFNSKSLQKTYLPPFAQRNLNQRNGSNNARNGYRY